MNWRAFALVAAALLFACQRGSNEQTKAAQPATTTAAPSPEAKPPSEIPITSASNEAIAAFKRGRDLAENIRLAEAAAEFETALKLDPNFVQARAYLGQVTWPDGHEHLRKAVASSSSLPIAERTLIEYLRAASVHDVDAQDRALQQLAALVPGDARPHSWMGNLKFGLGRYSEAATALRKAVELNPSDAGSWNQLGYVAIEQLRFDEAIAAFRKYAELRPTEPNPLDSLADAQLMSGRYDEAEANYRRALEISPEFVFSWQGIGVARALGGDFDGAREALHKGIAAAKRPIDKLTPRFDIVWTFAAERRLTDALAAVADLEKAAKESGIQQTYANSANLRAAILLDQGKARDALREIKAAHQRLDAAVGRAPPVAIHVARGWARRLETDAYLRLGKPAQAERVVREFEEALTDLEPTQSEQNNLNLARGYAALARNDTRAAAGHFEKCPARAFLCVAQLALAREKIGDQADAEEARKQFLSRSHRSAEYVYVKRRVLGIEEAVASGAVQ